MCGRPLAAMELGDVLGDATHSVYILYISFYILYINFHCTLYMVVGMVNNHNRQLIPVE